MTLAPGKIYYLELGKGPELLFLHGAVATPEAYLPLLKLLAEDFHIVAPVHPGHGASFAIPPDWKLGNFVNFYQDFLGDLGIAPRVLIGHSFGGTLALLLASQGVGQQAIVMDAPGLPFQFAVPEYARALGNEARELLRQRPDLRELNGAAKAAGTLFQTVIRHPRDLSIFSQDGPKFNILRQLRKIPITVELLWGGNDQIVPVALGQKMQLCLPSAHLTIFPGRGHNYPATDPEFTYREITKILQRQGGG